MNNPEKFLKMMSSLIEAGVLTSQDLAKALLTSMKFNREKIANKLELLRQYGWNNKRESQLIGINSRMDEIQAAVLNVKIKKLNINNNKRKKYYWFLSIW